jgi:hypothetical protein
VLFTHSLTLKAFGIIAIQVQLLLAPTLNKITRALLSIGIVLELLGILFAICSVQIRNADDAHHFQPLSNFDHVALRVPIVLILTGVVGLGAALVVETLETSLGTAVTMSSFLIFGVVSCILILIRGARKVDGGNDKSIERI